jgi:hypothetical protein
VSSRGQAPQQCEPQVDLRPCLCFEQGTDALDAEPFRPSEARGVRDEDRQRLPDAVNGTFDERLHLRQRVSRVPLRCRNVSVLATRSRMKAMRAGVSAASVPHSGQSMSASAAATDDKASAKEVGKPPRLLVNLGALDDKAR